MTELEHKLQQAPEHLAEFFHNTAQALSFLRDETKLTAATDTHSIYQVASGSEIKILRPVRTSLFITDPQAFVDDSQDLVDKLSTLVGSGDAEHGPQIDRVLYTATQAHGCLFDARLPDGAARKSMGTIFATLIRNVLTAAGVDNKALSVNLSTEEWSYRYPLDVVANRAKVESTTESLSANDLLISCMTTTKDRLARTFADKILLERYFDHPVRLAVVALHDVQRKGTTDVTWTFLPNVFLLNWTYLAHLEALYYLDVPATAMGGAFADKIHPVHELVLNFPA